MADPVGSEPGASEDDALLTAYLDGELEPAARLLLEARLQSESGLRRRLELLEDARRGIAPAFDALLGVAPVDRLQALLADVQRQRAHNAQKRRIWRPAAMAAAIALLLLGGSVGFLVSTLMPHEAPGWRQVVAEYQVLTTADTLAAIPDDPAFVGAEVAAASAKLDLPLDTQQLTLPDAALKRAQMFEFRGRPLAQFAYLAPEGPVALCIINNGRPDADLAYEEREGSSIVFWTKDGRGYMVIGKVPRATLEAYAAELAARIS